MSHDKQNIPNIDGFSMMPFRRTKLIQTKGRTMASSEPLPVGTPDAGSASLHWHLPRRRSGAADAGRSAKK